MVVRGGVSKEGAGGHSGQATRVGGATHQCTCQGASTQLALPRPREVFFVLDCKIETASEEARGLVVCTAQEWLIRERDGVRSAHPLLAGCALYASKRALISLAL